MKQLYLLLICVLFFEIAQAQPPQKLNYQAIARNSSGAPLVSQAISLQFTIRNLTSGGAELYRETFSNVQTNPFGLFTVEIGEGIQDPLSGDFSDIDWGSGDKYLQAELDVANGTNFVDMGSSQLLSVPYALHAANGLPGGTATGDMLYWSGTNWSIVPVGLPGQVLVLNGANIPEWQNAPVLLQAPVVTIHAATDVTTTTATLNGKVNANNLYTTVAFEYGLTASYGNQIPASPGSVSGIFDNNVNAALSGLQSGTTYHCRLTATNAVNTSYSNDTTFTTDPDYTLTTSRAGNGSGLVTSTPAGINCGGTCSAAYAGGTMVTLTASPLTGSTFAGWSGGCTGVGSCVVTINSLVSVTATFTLSAYPLTVSPGGTGSGTVTSSPAGINCGLTCSALYNYGTVVTLTATPDIGSTFAGWSGGGCSGTGTCVTTITSATGVTAVFN